MSEPSQVQIEAFLYHEARLLDEGRFETWLGLYAPDCRYWIPARHGQVSPVDEVSLMYDDYMTLQTRVGRLLHPRAHAQLPRSRTVHVVTNILVHRDAAADGLLRVQSVCQMYEFRPPDTTHLVGLQEHHLRKRDRGFLVVSKRIDLLHCDQALRSLQIPI